MLLQDATQSAPPATMGVVWQIVAISLAMVALSQLFRWKFSLSRSEQAHFQEQVQSLQDEAKLAQARGDQQRLTEIQQEMMDFSRDLMKKQFIPMCGRTIVFLVIFWILSSVYGKYDFSGILGGLGWFWLYFLISLGANLIIGAIRKAIKKSRGVEDEQPVMDNIKALQRNLSVNQGSMMGMGGMPSGFNQGASMNSQPQDTDTDHKERFKNSEKSWKKKLADDDD